MPFSNEEALKLISTINSLMGSKHVKILKFLANDIKKEVSDDLNITIYDQLNEYISFLRIKKDCLTFDIFVGMVTENSILICMFYASKSQLVWSNVYNNYGEACRNKHEYLPIIRRLFL